MNIQKRLRTYGGLLGKRSMQVSVGVGEKIHLSHLAMASEWKWDGCRIRSKSGGWCMHALSVSSSLSFFFSWLRFFPQLSFYHHQPFPSMGLRVRLGLAHSLEAASSLTRSYFITADFQQHHGRMGGQGMGMGERFRVLRARVENLCRLVGEGLDLWEATSRVTRQGERGFFSLWEGNGICLGVRLTTATPP